MGWLEWWNWKNVAEELLAVQLYLERGNEDWGRVGDEGAGWSWFCWRWTA